MRLRFGIIPYVFLFGATMMGQETLTLEGALCQVMENNHGLKMAQLDTVVSRNNATWGNAGLWPKIYMAGGYQYSENDTELDFAPLDSFGGLEGITADRAETTRENLSINMEYVLFNGMAHVRTLQLSRTVDSLARLRTKYQVERTVLRTVEHYLQTAFLQADLAISREQLQISLEHLQRIRTMHGYGAVNRGQLLQAEVHVKNDSVALRKKQLDYQKSKTAMNELMGRAPGTGFQVTESVDFLSVPSKALLKSMVEKNNSRLRLWS